MPVTRFSKGDSLRMFITDEHRWWLIHACLGETQNYSVYKWQLYYDEITDDNLILSFNNEILPQRMIREEEHQLLELLVAKRKVTVKAPVSQVLSGALKIATCRA